MTPNQSAAEKVVLDCNIYFAAPHTQALVAAITALLDAKDREIAVLWAECEEARKTLPVRHGRYITPVFIAMEYGSSDWIDRMLATRAATDAAARAVVEAGGAESR